MPDVKQAQARAKAAVKGGKAIEGIRALRAQLAEDNPAYAAAVDLKTKRSDFPAKCAILARAEKSSKTGSKRTCRAPRHDSISGLQNRKRRWRSRCENRFPLRSRAWAHSGMPALAGQQPIVSEERGRSGQGCPAFADRFREGDVERHVERRCRLGTRI